MKLSKGLAVALLAAGVAQAAPVELKLWRHETVGDAEMKASARTVEEFNASQTVWHVVAENLPEGSYRQAVVAAAITHRLPCILDLDQPAVPNFAWAGHIRPLEGALKPRGADALIPGGRSTYKGRLYSVGQFDVALALFARASVLRSHDIRVATLDKPYSAEEFRQILRKLRGQGWRYPFDLNAQFTGEWVAYAYSPWFESAGADLIDRSDLKTVDGVLNGDAAIRVADYYRSLFEERLASRKPLDDQAFPSGRAAFQYTGSWAAEDYRKRIGDDLVVMPPPSFGTSPRIGGGSWQWAVSSSCPNPEGAKAFLEFVISTEQITKFSNATGFMPTSEAAANASLLYRPGAWGRIFFELAKAYAVTRPATPAYPVISSAFEEAMADIRDGVDSADALDRATETIRQDLKRNHDYGF